MRGLSALVLCFGGLAAMGACSSSSGRRADGGQGGIGGQAGNDAGNDVGNDTAALDGADGDADSSPPPRPTSFRLAHLSPDLQAVDVCLAPHGTGDYQGPLLGQLAAPDGGAPGVSYSQVSVYLPVDPGAYDLRLVEAGSASCASPPSSAVVPDTTNLPAFAAASKVTVLVVGELAPTGNDASLQIVAVADDATLAGGAAVLRAVNAIASVSAEDFGFGSFAGGWQPLFTGVAFGAASAHVAPSAGVLDPDGYLPIAPLSGQLISARPSVAATADTAVAHDLEIDVGSIATLFAIGGKTGDPVHPPALLLCIDNQTSGGGLSDCSISP